MANFCGTCGKEVEPGVKFCGSCGSLINAGEGAPVGGQQAAEGGEQMNAQAAGQNAAAGQAASAGSGQTAAAGQAAAASGGATAQSGGGQAQAQQAINSIMKIAQETADSTDEMDPADIEKNKFIACSAYILFFIPLLACPDSKFGKYHTNQGLLVLLLYIAGWIVTSVIRWILPGILFWLANLVSLIVYLPIFGLMVLGIYNAYQGKAKDLPYIGTIRIIK